MLLLEFEMMIDQMLELYKSSGDPPATPFIFPASNVYDCNRAVKLQMLKICGFLFNHLFLAFFLDKNGKEFSISFKRWTFQNLSVKHYCSIETQ